MGGKQHGSTWFLNQLLIAIMWVWGHWDQKFKALWNFSQVTNTSQFFVPFYWLGESHSTCKRNQTSFCASAKEQRWTILLEINSTNMLNECLGASSEKPWISTSFRQLYLFSNFIQLVPVLFTPVQLCMNLLNFLGKLFVSSSFSPLLTNFALYTIMPWWAEPRGIW